jgi:hypothetical protein
VAARAVGIGVRRVTVESYEYAEGRCSFRLPDVWPTHHIEQQLMVSLAGSMAQQRVDGNGAVGQESRHDHQLAVMLAADVTGDPHEAHAYLDWIRQRTHNLLCQPLWWMAVLGFAERLIDERTMSALRCRSAIKEAVDDGPEPYGIVTVSDSNGT